MYVSFLHRSIIISNDYLQHFALRSHTRMDSVFEFIITEKCDFVSSLFPTVEDWWPQIHLHIAVVPISMPIFTVIGWSQNVLYWRSFVWFRFDCLIFDFDWNDMYRIGSLSSLEVLDVYYNRALLILPDSVSKLRSLKSLEISMCNLSKLPDRLVCVPAISTSMIVAGAILEVCLRVGVIPFDVMPQHVLLTMFLS